MTATPEPELIPVAYEPKAAATIGRTTTGGSSPRRRTPSVTGTPTATTGLVLECHDGRVDGEPDWAELCPDRLGFGEPWDGTYDTWVAGR